MVLESKETIESVRFMAGFWKDAHDEGGLAWDDTNNNRAFLSGEICASLNGASIYVAALRGRRQVQDREGRAAAHRHPACADAEGARRGRPYHTAFTHMVMKYSKNQKVGKDFLRWAHTKENYEKWFIVQKGFAIAPTRELGEAPDVEGGPGDAAVQQGLA